MRIRAALTLLLAALAALAPVHDGEAQSWRRRRGDPGDDGEPRGRVAEVDRREQIKRRIRAMRAHTLTEELALDESTAGRLFPLLARYDNDTDRLVEQRVELQRRLRLVERHRADAPRSPADARAIERLIDEAVANQRALWDLEDRRLVELRKVLTPVQTAKLLLVMPAIERRIQSQLRKAIVRRGELGRAGGDAGARREDRDDLDPFTRPDALERDEIEPDEIPPPPPQPPARRPARREAPLAPGRPTAAPANAVPCDPRSSPCR